MEMLLGKVLAKLDGVARSQQLLVDAALDTGGQTKGLRRMRTIQELEHYDQELGRTPAMKAVMVRVCTKE